MATITAKTTAQTSVDLTITVKEVNKDALQEAYNNNKDKNSETYTPASWQVFNLSLIHIYIQISLIIKQMG